MARLLILNMGLLLSGDLKDPIPDADTVLAVDGGSSPSANRRILMRGRDARH